jgi:hippurate hydrolase
MGPMTPTVLDPASDTAPDDIAALRRDIHAHPELGFEEQRTADLVADRLMAWGVPIDRRFAKTGVIGLVHGRDGGASGRLVGLRADMDALPVHEANTFAHASRHAGVMHACGHDGHTAMLLGAAQRLARERDFDGTAVLIFQPAEEGRGGAQAMIAEGLFEQYPVEAVFGLHNWPGYPQGSIACSAGPVMASANTFKLVIHGRGSHAALPHESVDPVPLACQIVQAWQTIVSRNKRPIDTAVLSVTMVHAGEAGNVVPDTCVIEGTVRTYRAEVTDLIERRMRLIAEHSCAAFEARAEFEFLRRAPAVVNHAHEAAVAQRVAARVCAPGLAMVQEPAMPSEDFAFMLLARPGAYAFIGNGDGDHRTPGHGEGPCMLHNPSYDFNDALLPLGASFWVELVKDWLAHPAPVR